MRVTIGPPDVLRVLEIILRVEIADLTRDLAIERAGVERLDSPDAADAVPQVAPERIEILADRRDDAHAGDDDSAVGIH